MAEEKTAAVEKNEIATIAKDINYPAFGGILQQTDDTLLTRGGGKGLKVYDEIERDCYAYGVLQKRKLAVVAREWAVVAASESPLDKRAAEVCQRQLENIGVPSDDNIGDEISVATNFDVVCYNLLDAILKGFSVGEVMWEYAGGGIVARTIHSRDQRRFNFDTERKLRLKTRENLYPGEVLPTRKFIVHSLGAKDGSPYGLGLGSKLFWPVFFKRQDITFWLTFADKFGTPTVVGKYPAGTLLEDQLKLLDSLQNIAQDTGIAVPTDMVLELLEATRGGASDFYERLARYLDEQMGWAVLGDAPGGKDSGGALASAAILRNEVRLELVKADADLLSATLNSTLLPWITQLNVPGAKPPKVWRDTKANEDLKARSERDKNIFAMGFRPTIAAITETYGGEWELVPEPNQVPAKIAKEPANFAESDSAEFADQVALDKAINALQGGDLQTQMESMLKPIVDLVNSATPDQVMEQLVERYPDMDTKALEDLLARAIFVAEVWGRLNAED